MQTDESRRRFLKFLAASPLLAACADRKFLDQPKGDPEQLIAAANEALDVFDFEPVAKKNIPIGHWGYLMTGTDDDGTLRANREGYAKWDLRMRRLVDIAALDTSVELLGRQWDTPIFLCPLSSQKAFHPEGEIATARAAKAKGHLQVLSTVATSSIEDVIAARGEPVWFQLYHRQDWNATKQMLDRAEKAGAPAVVFTVDLIGGSNRETMIRLGRQDTRKCENCHEGGAPMPGIKGGAVAVDNRRKPALADIKPGPTDMMVGSPTWEYVRRIKDATSMKVFIKGVVTKEDAELAVEYGASGVVVSNHGGRAENSGRATVLSLPEVVAGARGRVPVLLDGGIRRGTDVFKALALGATAVGIGRPYIWGLGAFGQEGVEAVLRLLRAETEMVMKQAGTMTVKSITPAYLVSRGA